MPLHNNRWSVLALVSLLCIVAVASSGQDDGQKKEPTKDGAFESKEPPADKTVPLPYWETDRSLQDRAALHLLAASNPWYFLGNRILASNHQPELKGWAFEFDEVLPLYSRYLQLLEDGRELPVRDPRKPKQLSVADNAMLLTYNQALDRSHASTMEMFEKSALTFNYVKYSHLKSQPADYRGKIITVEGRLKVIRKHKAPPYLPDTIEHIYTGWIVGPHKTLPPFTIAFTDLPPDMRVSESLDFPVSFMGYFIGFVKFPPDTPKQKEVISPYVIGKTFTVVDEKKIGQIKNGDDGEKTSYASQYILWTLGAIIVVALLIASMNIWFRRGDDAVKSRLAEVREKSQPFQLEDESAAPPIEPPSTVPPPP